MSSFFLGVGAGSVRKQGAVVRLQLQRPPSPAPHRALDGGVRGLSEVCGAEGCVGSFQGSEGARRPAVEQRLAARARDALLVRSGRTHRSGVGRASRQRRLWLSAGSERSSVSEFREQASSGPSGRREARYDRKVYLIPVDLDMMSGRSVHGSGGIAWEARIRRGTQSLRRGEVRALSRGLAAERWFGRAEDLGEGRQQGCASGGGDNHMLGVRFCLA